jgi:hypothetical protein
MDEQEDSEGELFLCVCEMEQGKHEIENALSRRVKMKTGMIVLGGREILAGKVKRDPEDPPLYFFAPNFIH